jgi:hypothetical protein
VATKQAVERFGQCLQRNHPADHPLLVDVIREHGGGEIALTVPLADLPLSDALVGRLLSGPERPEPDEIARRSLNSLL